MAELFGTDINTIAQFLLFLIILIFDPLAVLFVVIINLDFININISQKSRNG